MSKTAFIGHRQLFAKDIDERLTNAIRAEIENGCMSFTMGTHGEFDSLALYICRKLRHDYPKMQIEVVLTSLHIIEKERNCDFDRYYDVNTVMYEIEDVHYKRQITLSNKKMIDTCDTLICYVNTSENSSGAKTALRYAEKRGLNVINLWREQDQPFYDMTKDQKEEYWKNFYEQFTSPKK